MPEPAMPLSTRARPCAPFASPYGRALAALLATTLLLTACGRDSRENTAGDLRADPAIQVLSNRSDLISGDDA
ncbi:hypothetical protein ABTQ03_19575, partial [Acinetobacter baumannii]